MKDLHGKAFATRAVHAGERVRPLDFLPVVTPIHPTVGFLYDSMDDLDAALAGTKEGYVYARWGSPTVTAFETQVAELEGGEAAHAFGSGMGALHAALLAAGVRAGTAVVAAFDLYGASIVLLRRLLSEQGVSVHLVDVTDLAAVERLTEQVRPVAFLAETVSNPLLKVANLPALAALAHRHGAQCLIDNTFASPYLCNPLAHGADYVIHSATKYLAGHGDVVAGVVVTSAGNRRKLFEVNQLLGGVLGPFEAWLAMRGCKTLPLRMRQQCANAVRLAEWLVEHPRIARVNFPGLPRHPQHDLAQRLFGDRGYGGMLSFEVAGADRPTVYRIMEALAVCQTGTTLGDIYTQVVHPASSSHRCLTQEERDRVGIRESLLRLSAGIEDADDIIADLAQALAAG